MIPRIIHQLWVGPPMPATYQAFRRTVIDHHPDWEHRLWGDTDFGWLKNQHLYDEAEFWAPGSVGQFRSDVARYEILAEHGGVWVDVDCRWQRPIDHLIEGVDCFAGWETEPQWINNAVMGATPGHPFLLELIDQLPASVRRHRGKRPNVMTGPQFLTPIARRHDVTVFPQACFYPALWNQLDAIDSGEFPDSYCVHDWANARRRKGQARA